MITPNAIEVKAYSISELSAMYGISNKTMNRWMKPYAAIIGKREGRYYTALQVRIIFDKLGLPGKIYEAPATKNGLTFLLSIIYFLYDPFMNQIDNLQF